MRLTPFHASSRASSPSTRRFPTPALSLGEREAHIPTAGESEILGNSNTRTRLFPLPEGEGKGEGEARHRAANAWVSSDSRGPDVPLALYISKAAQHFARRFPLTPALSPG